MRFKQKQFNIQKISVNVLWVLLLLGMAFIIREIIAFVRSLDLNIHLNTVRFDLEKYADRNQQDVPQKTGSKEEHSWRAILAAQAQERESAGDIKLPYNFGLSWRDEINRHNDFRWPVANADGTAKFLGIFNEDGSWFWSVYSGVQHHPGCPKPKHGNGLKPVMLVALPGSGVMWNEPVDIVYHRASHTLTLRGKVLDPKRLSECQTIRYAHGLSRFPRTSDPQQIMDLLLGDPEISGRSLTDAEREAAFTPPPPCH